MCNAIIMKKLVLSKDNKIYLFIPEKLITVEKIDEKYYDKNGEEYVFINNKKICDENIKKGISFPLANKELADFIRTKEKFTLDEYKNMYFKIISSYLHIGYYLSSLDKVGIISKNLEQMYNKTLNINEQIKFDGFIACLDEDNIINYDLSNKQNEFLMIINNLIKGLFEIDNIDDMYNEINNITNQIHKLTSKYDNQNLNGQYNQKINKEKIDNKIISEREKNKRI